MSNIEKTNQLSVHSFKSFVNVDDKKLSNSKDMLDYITKLYSKLNITLETELRGINGDLFIYMLDFLEEFNYISNLTVDKNQIKNNFKIDDFIDFDVRAKTTNNIMSFKIINTYTFYNKFIEYIITTRNFTTDEINMIMEYIIINNLSKNELMNILNVMVTEI